MSAVRPSNSSPLLATSSTITTMSRLSPVLVDEEKLMRRHPSEGRIRWTLSDAWNYFTGAIKSLAADRELTPSDKDLIKPLTVKVANLQYYDERLEAIVFSYEHLYFQLSRSQLISENCRAKLIDFREVYQDVVNGLPEGIGCDLVGKINKKIQLDREHRRVDALEKIFSIASEISLPVNKAKNTIYKCVDEVVDHCNEAVALYAKAQMLVQAVAKIDVEDAKTQSRAIKEKLDKISASAEEAIGLAAYAQQVANINVLFQDSVPNKEVGRVVERLQRSTNVKPDLLRCLNDIDVEERFRRLQIMQDPESKAAKFFYQKEDKEFSENIMKLWQEPAIIKLAKQHEERRAWSTKPMAFFSGEYDLDDDPLDEVRQGKVRARSLLERGCRFRQH